MSSVNAVNLQDRIPTVSGKKLWILTDLENNPIQEAWTALNITPTTTWYISRLSNENTLEWAELVHLETIKDSGWKFLGSCKQLLEKNPNLQDQDGEYYLSLSSIWFKKVYCDMTTDWGGWTFFLHVDGAIHWSDFFEKETWTYMSDRSDTGEHYSLASNNFEHTEMMVTREAVSPETSTFYRAFQYNQWHSWFNRWPIPCTWLENFSYKTSINGSYESDVLNSTCNISQWYTTWPVSNTDYVVLFLLNTNTAHTGTFLIGAWSWQEESYWYLR